MQYELVTPGGPPPQAAIPAALLTANYFVAVEPKPLGNSWIPYSGGAAAFGIITLIGLVITTILAFVGGINSFNGVTFLYHWVFGYAILYLVFSVVTYIFLILLVIALKGEAASIPFRTKTWEHRHTQNIVLILMFVVIVISVIPLCVYGFTIGNGEPCDALACNVAALVFGNNVFSILWLSMFGYFVIFALIGKLAVTWSVDEYRMTTDEARAFYMSRLQKAEILTPQGYPPLR